MIKAACALPNKLTIQHQMLFFRPFIRGLSSIGLFLHQGRDMLLAEAERAACWEQLGIGCRFATGITTPNMCFYSFHTNITSIRYEAAFAGHFQFL
jgi:hypothetical protein